MTSTKAGTSTYFSPQKMLGQKHSDSKADMWAIGCVLVELLRGKRLDAGLWKSHDNVKEGEAHKALREEMAGKSSLLGDAALGLLEWDEGNRNDASALVVALKEIPESIIAHLKNDDRSTCPMAVHGRSSAFYHPATPSNTLQHPACPAWLTLNTWGNCAQQATGADVLL